MKLKILSSHFTKEGALEFLKQNPLTARDIIREYLDDIDNYPAWSTIVLDGVRVLSSTKIVECKRCGEKIINTWWVNKNPLCYNCFTTLSNIENKRR